MAAAELKLGIIDEVANLGDINTQMKNLIYDDASRAQGINDLGGVIGWIMPDPNKVHCAWNPIRYVAFQILYETTTNPMPTNAPYSVINLTGGGTIRYYINIDYRGTYQLKIQDADENIYTLEADGMKTTYAGAIIYSDHPVYGGAEFNINLLAQKNYKHITWASGNSLTRLIHYTTYNYVYVLNGVVQQGETPQLDWLTTDSVRLLTQQTLIREWGQNDGGDFNSDYNDDYGNGPQSAGSEPEVTLFYAQTTGGDDPHVERITIHDIDDIQRINTLLGENILEYGASCEGISVKWLNSTGGIDGWVFTPRDKRTRKAKTSGYVDIYSPDPYNVKDTIDVYDIDAEDTLTLGCDNVPKRVYKALKWLPLSRDIIMYFPNVSVAANRWQQVTVESYDVSESDQNGCVDFEITFRLPKLNLMV